MYLNLLYFVAFTATLVTVVRATMHCDGQHPPHLVMSYLTANPSDVRIYNERYIANGAFGSVSEVNVNGCQAARKCAFAPSAEVPAEIATQSLAALKRELEMLLLFQHTFVVQVLIPILVDNCLYLQFYDTDMAHADLLLRGYQHGDILLYALQLAQAIDYIHQEHYVLNDVKPQNMLFSYRYNVPALSDFGMVTKDGEASGGTEAYSGPEILVNRGRANDIHGYGLALPHMWGVEAKAYLQWRRCAERCDLSMETAQQEFGFKHCDALGNDLQGYMTCPKLSPTELFPHSVPRPIKDLIEWCLHPEPTKRPSAEQITAYIQVLQKGGQPKIAGSTMELDKCTNIKAQLLEYSPGHKLDASLPVLDYKDVKIDFFEGLLKTRYTTEQVYSGRVFKCPVFVYLTRNPLAAFLRDRRQTLVIPHKDGAIYRELHLIAISSATINSPKYPTKHVLVYEEVAADTSAPAKEEFSLRRAIMHPRATAKYLIDELLIHND